jgi:hypothetical protein
MNYACDSSRLLIMSRMRRVLLLGVGVRHSF